MVIGVSFDRSPGIANSKSDLVDPGFNCEMLGVHYFGLVLIRMINRLIVLHFTSVAGSDCSGDWLAILRGVLCALVW
jgi:hypothetical protein